MSCFRGLSSVVATGEDDMTFGRAIGEARKGEGWSPRDVASRIQREYGGRSRRSTWTTSGATGGARRRTTWCRGSQGGWGSGMTGSAVRWAVSLKTCGRRGSPGRAREGHACVQGRPSRTLRKRSAVRHVPDRTGRLSQRPRHGADEPGRGPGPPQRGPAAGTGRPVAGVYMAIPPPGFRPSPCRS